MFKDEVKKMLKEIGETVFIEGERPRVFDVAFKYKKLNVEIKISKNLEMLRGKDLDTLSKGAKSIGAKAIIIAERGKTTLKDGVIYRRRDVLAMNKETFMRLINGEEVSIATRGGEVVPVKNVGEIMKKKGIRIEELARKLGVTAEMVRRYAKEESYPTPEIAKKLKKILGEEIINKKIFDKEFIGEKIVFVGKAPYEIVFRESKPVLVSLKKDEKRKKNIEGVANLFDLDYEFV